jgi:hypothetical protein
MRLADPSALSCFTEDGNTINAVIETPKGSRNKFARKIFRLKKGFARRDGVSLRFRVCALH